MLYEVITPPALRAVSSMPGLQRAVADLIEELDAAGVDFATGTSSHFEPVLAIAVRVREMVEQRGFRMRSDRFRKAADRVRSGGLPDVREVLFDGFFRFTQIELELIRGLAESVDVTVVITSYSIHYTKLYETLITSAICSSGFSTSSDSGRMRVANT